MGITGLITFMEKACSPVNIKEFRGKTVAVDTYCWLHKGAFACSFELVQGTKTDVHIQYCMKYVNMLLSHEIKPILVFDGMHLPAKKDTETKRRESRQNSKKRGVELMQLGKIDEARQQFKRCVDITHEIALELIKECRKRNVDCIVAPYEADAELAYLNKISIADYIITEDSDLVLFGCQKVLFKLTLSGSCLLMDSTKLHLTMPNCRPEKFSFKKFRMMCILSGCDYVDSLSGIGLAKACKFVMKTEETDMRKALPKMPAYLNMRQLEVTDEYIDNYLKAEATFLHMFVYDPIQRKIVRLNDPDEEGTDLKFCSNAGEFLDDKTAFQLALGNINPFTMKVLDNYNPDVITQKPLDKSKKIMVSKYPSIWQRGFNATDKLEVKQRLDLKSFVTKPISSNLVLKVLKEEQIEVDTIGLDDDDLVMSYCQPPQKKSKLQDFRYPFSLEENPKVNPFSKKQEYQEQDETSDVENLSLIRKTSPVKKSIHIFKKTIENEKHKVISRFFQSQSNMVIHTPSSHVSEVTAKQLDSAGISELTDETDDEKSKDSDVIEKNDKLAQDDKIEEELIVDLDLYEEKPPPRVTMKKEKITSKPSILGKCRRVGLTKSKLVPSSSQGKLSSFGFTKKPSLT